MNDIVSDSLYFGMALSILAYFLGEKIRKRFDYAFCNPLLLASAFVIIFLLITGIDYESYAYGARNMTYFLTPVTVCLAVPLYKQLIVLKKNLPAVLISIVCGCISHAVVLILTANLVKLDTQLLQSLLSKSVTTAIALGVTQEVGGVPAVTVVGVTIAGLLGAITGPLILKLFRISEPVAQGLAMGSASHAIGTSKAVEMGEIQGAMSSLAIVVTGLLTVVIVPLLSGGV